jgi:hypothetical protein
MWSQSRRLYVEPWRVSHPNSFVKLTCTLVSAGEADSVSYRTHVCLDQDVGGERRRVKVDRVKEGLYDLREVLGQHACR